MVLPVAQYPDVYTDTFIFFLRSLCKIIWMNVHYFPNAPRTMEKIRSNTVKGFNFAVLKFRDLLDETFRGGFNFAEFEF